LNIKHVILLLVVTKFTISGLQGQSKKAEKAQKNAEKIERFQRIFYQKARKKVVKSRKKMQHKETQKMMQLSNRRSRKFNKRHNDIFIVRFFVRRKKRR